MHRSIEGRGQSAAVKTCAVVGGLRIEKSSDFEKFRAVTAQIGRHPPSPTFDFRSNDLGPSNAFWLAGIDDRGDVVHTQAVRKMSFRGRTLESHLRRHADRYRPDDETVHPASLRLDPCAGLQVTARAACWQGEVWIRPDFRRRGVCPDLVKFGMSLAVSLWDPDIIWAIITPGVSHSKFVNSIGYPNFAPWVVHWLDRQGHEVERESLSWVTRAELARAFNPP